MSFQAAHSWLQHSVTKYAGEDATIRRGHREINVKVVRGSASPKLITEGERATMELQGQDFLIRPGSYVFDSIHDTPLPGDRILITGRNGIEQYVVTPFEAGKPCFMWNDQYQSFYRVFSQYEDPQCPVE